MGRRISLGILTVCMLACAWLRGSGESPPGAATPTATDAGVSTSSPTPSPAPPATATPTPFNLALDLSDPSPLYSARPAWRALLGWPADCEAGFQLIERQAEDPGGIAVYPLADAQYFVLVDCTLGPYWVEERPYWIDNRSGAPSARALSVPEMTPGAQGWEVQLAASLHGLPVYDPDTQTLRNLAPARGLKDCGTLYQYRLEPQQLVLVEARYQECSNTEVTAIIPETWPLIYPAAGAERAGPFRQIQPLPPALGDAIKGLEALPDGGLRVLTTQGYATLRDGVWNSTALDDGQILIGIDALERAWLLDATGDISYRRADGELTPAGEGWLPIAYPRALAGRGVVTDHLGQVWLTTSQDVRMFDGARWTLFTRETLGMPPAADPELLSDFTLTFVPARQQLWIGECDSSGPGPFGGGGARWFDGTTWRGTQTSLSGGCVTAIVADAEGRVWIGMDHGLAWNFDQTTGNWQQFLLPEPTDYRRGYPIALTLDPTGTPWLLSALCGGASCDATRALYHFQEDAWVEIAGLSEYTEGQLYSGAFSSLLFDSTGTPWFFLPGEALQIAGQQLVQPSAAELYVQAGTVDASGQVWVVGWRAVEPPALWLLEGGAP